MKYLDLFNDTPIEIYENILIMSFQPYAYNLIFSGEKKLEYRKRYRNRKSIVFVYVSTPIKEIRGVLYLDKPISGDAMTIANYAEKQKPGSFESIYKYFESDNFGNAIPIVKYFESVRISLADLREKFEFVAPQSYMLGSSNRMLTDFLISSYNVELSFLNR